MDRPNARSKGDEREPCDVGTRLHGRRTCAFYGDPDLGHPRQSGIFSVSSASSPSGLSFRQFLSAGSEWTVLGDFRRAQVLMNWRAPHGSFRRRASPSRRSTCAPRRERWRPCRRTAARRCSRRSGSLRGKSPHCRQQRSPRGQRDTPTRRRGRERARWPLHLAGSGARASRAAVAASPMFIFQPRGRLQEARILATEARNPACRLDPLNLGLGPAGVEAD